MALHHPTVHLEDEQLRALEHLALEERQSVDELIRRAVDRYLAQRRRDTDDWGERFDRLVAQVQVRMRSDVAPAEIEADIGAAREQVRSERAGAIEGIRRGLESAARNDGRPVEEIFAELRSRYGPPAEA
jgi:predicted transcriptional regulator